MSKLKRATAAVITAVMLLSCSISVWATLPDYIPEEYFTYADLIADAARQYRPSCELPKDSNVYSDELRTVMSLVYNRNPDLFHLSTAYRYTYSTDSVTGKAKVLGVLLYYNISEEDYADAVRLTETWVSKVVSLADPSFTEMEYALFFHDYIASNYEYDTAFQSRSLYSLITTGKGVCQAYTYAYSALLEAVGIEVSYASSDEMNHIWNLVKIDGHWYHVDVTWDDPVGSVPGIAHHDYFLLSDSAISTEEKNHYGWIALHDCTSDTYDGVFGDRAESSYAHRNGTWYYLSGGDLYSTASPDTDGSVFMELDLRWYVWESTAFYTSTYGAILADGGMLYVSTPDGILRIDPATGSSDKVYTYKGGDGYVYGMTVDMGSDGVSGAAMETGLVVIHVSVKPGAAGKLVKIAIDGRGDANGDGKINLADASLVLKYVAKWDIEMDTDSADYDRNGKVNLSDVNGILKRIAGWT